MMKVNGYEIRAGANLRGADLQYANLQYANLQNADLQYANLQYANLQGADLQYANLQYANLQGADLQYANLQNANLKNADLRYTRVLRTILQPVNVYEWVVNNVVDMRNLDYRTMCMFRRSRKSLYQGNETAYRKGKLYKAPIFSRCPVTDCHPGLYVAGEYWKIEGSATHVACWLDEIHITAQQDNKARVPKFYVLGCNKTKALEMFNKLKSSDLEG